MTMNEQKVLEGARNMVAKHITRIAQAHAGTNFKRRVNVTRNYLEDLKKLKTYLYGGQSNVRNILGFERALLNRNIRTAENGLAAALHEYVFHLGRNVIQTARNIHEEHMINAPKFNRNWTLTEKKRYYERQAKAAHRILHFIRGQAEAEPMLSQNERIKRVIDRFETAIERYTMINRTLNTALSRIQSRKRKFPGSFY